jgi:hypothetical protein
LEFQWSHAGRLLEELLEAEALVFLMCADPEPSDDVPFAKTKCSVVFADPDDANAVAPLLEPEGGDTDRVFIARISRV